MEMRRNVSGAAFRSLRVARGWSQEDFAVRCQVAGWDVDRKLLSKIETGLREVTDAEMRIAMKVLRCRPEEMFDMSQKGFIAARDVANRQ